MRVGAILLCLAAAAHADETVAIRDVRVFVDPETTIEKGTIVIRDGRILRVGTDVVPPEGARIIDGTGLFAYAGFFDAHCAAGLPDTKRDAEAIKAAQGKTPDYAKGASPAMEVANRKGIHPELPASRIVNLSESAAKGWLRHGFTTANVAAGSEYFSGRGVLLQLSGAPRRDAILVPETDLHAGFRSYGDDYPRTVMGVLAHIRQALLDAEHYARVHQEPAANGRRPPYDPGLEALSQLFTGEFRIVFEANTEAEIRRALGLGREFKIRVAIAGGAEAFKVTEELKAARATVLLSLKWPKKPKELKKEDLKKFVGKPEKLLKEQKRLHEEKIQCAIALHKSGVRFALSSRGAKPADAAKHIAKLIKLGLPREAALAALTTVPAEHFGVSDQAGRIEKGNLANIAVFSKELGEKGSKVRYAVVDGTLFEFESKEKPKGRPMVDLTGTWKASSETEMGSFEFTFELNQDGADLTGTVSSQFGEAEIKSGSVGGNAFEFTVTAGQMGDLAFSGEFKDDTLEGTMSGPGGVEREWTASRQPEKE